MLAKSKKELDALYRGLRSGRASLPAASTATTPAGAVSPAATGRAGRIDPKSPAVRLLNERFGSDWRYEIAEEERAGDEAIVLCRLIIGREGAVRTQFGRAKFAHSSVDGASGEMRFKLHSAAGGEDERDAFHRAAEVALMNCAELA